jgi:hypothetical protein
MERPRYAYATLSGTLNLLVLLDGIGQCSDSTPPGTEPGGNRLLIGVSETVYAALSLGLTVKRRSAL